MLALKTAVLASVALFVSAQAQYTIDPDSVDIDTRNSWCQSQESACPLLCLQLPGESSTTESNTCDPQTLDFECICGNGLSPNASEYSQTIPYFECNQWVQNCVAACNGDSTCQSACTQDHPCGAQNPKRVNVTSSTSAGATKTGGSASTTSGAVFTGFGGGAAATTAASSTSKHNSGNSAVEIGRTYGLAVVLTGIFAGFTLFM